MCVMFYSRLSFSSNFALGRCKVLRNVLIILSEKYSVAHFKSGDTFKEKKNHSCCDQIPSFKVSPHFARNNGILTAISLGKLAVKTLACIHSP